jgi:hypothetical protein
MGEKKERPTRETLPVSSATLPRVHRCRAESGWLCQYDIQAVAVSTLASVTG